MGRKRREGVDKARKKEQKEVKMEKNLLLAVRKRGRQRERECERREREREIIISYKEVFLWQNHPSNLFFVLGVYNLNLITHFFEVFQMSF